MGDMEIIKILLILFIVVAFSNFFILIFYIPILNEISEARVTIIDYIDKKYNGIVVGRTYMNKIVHLVDHKKELKKISNENIGKNCNIKFKLKIIFGFFIKIKIYIVSIEL